MLNTSVKQVLPAIGLGFLILFSAGCNFLGWVLRENTPPVPGMNGELNLDQVGSYSVSLSWSKATDEDDPSFSLEYAVYSCLDLEPFTDPEVVMANATVESGWIRDISSYTISGLETDTLFQFYLIVRDTQGAVALYQSLQAATVFIDTIPPIITLNGLSNMAVLLDQSFVDPGATALDNVDGELTGSIVVTGLVDTSTIGQYELIYNVSDTAGNAAAPLTRTVEVLLEDVSPPTLNLVGEASMTILQFEDFIDPGATAMDNIDGDISSLVQVSGAVDAHVPGSYQLSYDVSDAAGNAADTISRMVEVLAVDTTPPVISLLGENPMTITQFEEFSDPGATATDDRDGDLTAAIVVNGSVDIDTTGTYELTYDVADASGNTADTLTRTVVVETPDITAPTLTLLGEINISLPQNTSFLDPGATAVDDRDGDLTDSILVSGTVDTSSVGIYTLEYSVIDAAGNPSEILRRYVSVTLPDTTPPEIVLLGPPTFYLVVDGIYSEPGFYASDNIDEALSDEVIVTYDMDLTQVGTYEIQYDVVDSSGNAAITVYRTIIVEAVATNHAPVVVTSESFSTMDTYLSLYGGESWDPDGDTLTYSWDVDSVSTGSLINYSDDEYLDISTPDVDTYEITLTVSDGLLTDSTTITVEVLNSPPYLYNFNGPTHMSLGDTASLQYSGEDANYDPVTIDWLILETPLDSVSASLSNANTATGRVDFTPDVAGVYILECTITDGITPVSRTINITVLDADEGGIDVIFN